MSLSRLENVEDVESTRPDPQRRSSWFLDADERRPIGWGGRRARIASTNSRLHPRFSWRTAAH